MIEPAASVASGPAAVGGGAQPDRSATPDAVSRGFEHLLVEQLAKQLLETAGDSASAYASLLPGALADAVTDAGGLGLDLDGEGTRS